MLSLTLACILIIVELVNFAVTLFYLFLISFEELGNFLCLPV
jgi:hypothetical protein